MSTRMLSLVVASVATIAIAACGGPGASGGSATTPPTGSGAIPADHPLIGTWTTDVTRADMAAAGISDPAGQNENSGRFTWTFAPDGTWTQVQESLDGAPVMNPIFRGTYTVDGASFVMVTTFPPEYADAGLHYRWALEGDAMRFDLLDPPDATLPIIVETHPWARAGS
jgi:hypothetical protein